MKNSNYLDFLKIKTNNKKPEIGKILISEPFNQDFYFKRSIILLADYHKDGAMGFVLNNPRKQKITDVLNDFPSFDSNIYIGGPVQENQLFFIHTLGDQLLPDSIHITENIYFGGSYLKIKELIREGLVKNNQIKFFIGYSGWSANQLENELKNNYWLVENIDKEKIFSNEKDIWKDILQNLEPKYQMWTNFPENPDMN